MRPKDEDTWVAEYFDDILHEFGVDAYIKAREEWYNARDPVCDGNDTPESRSAAVDSREDKASDVGRG